MRPTKFFSNQVVEVQTPGLIEMKNIGLAMAWDVLLCSEQDGNRNFVHLLKFDYQRNQMAYTGES